MTKKKSSLWLNKTKRRKNEENRLSCDWTKKYFRRHRSSNVFQVRTPIRLTRSSPSPLNTDVAKNLQQFIVESRFVKQRSEIWTALRKTAYVTGSSIYDAIGSRGLKKHREHFALVFQGKVQNVEPDVAEKLWLWLWPRLLDTSQDCHFVEEGCYFKSRQHISTLIEVSPDGSLRNI